MTDLLSRPLLDEGVEPAAARGAVAPAAVSGLTAAGLGLLPITILVLLVWSTDGRSGSPSGDTLRTAGQAWFLAHHGGLALPAGHLGLVPLGLTLLPALLLVRAGASAARASGVADLRGAVGVTAALTTSYALVAALVGGLMATDAVRPVTAQGVLGAAVLAVLAGGAGVLRGSGLAAAAWAGVPPRLQSLLCATAGGVGVLLAGGAALSAAAVVLSFGDVLDQHRTVAPGLLGGVALLALQLAYLPTLVVWGAAYLTGAGFAVGTGTDVSPYGVDLGPLPGLPLLAALPGQPPTAVAVALLALPVAAGVVAGALLVRHRAALADEIAAAWGALAGLGLGVAMLVIAALAGGPAGPGRMAAVGPSAWQVALLVVAETAPAAAVTAWWVSRRTG